MQLTWFATFHDTTHPDTCVTEPELARLAARLAQTPDLTCGRVYTPWLSEGVYHKDGPAPQLQIQLYYASITALEAAISSNGSLQFLTDPATLPSLRNASVTEQAMLNRDFSHGLPPPPSQTSYCSYLVHYPGPAQDMNRWHQHYLAGHIPVMRRFPEIRGVEVASRLDWCSSLPWRRVHYMQRNKVVFDDIDALNAATSSPVMQDMRADLSHFPPYDGGNKHFAMKTLDIKPR
ncbi:hypothetical protein [Albirhodobacter sp. R86504]|uniref:hypothetical protein n=1 Tax=Albirhodobacter sp. R86504 TaxID=3093848 RepID=UPI0036724655